VHGKATGHGLGRKAPSEIVGSPGQRLAGRVAHTCRGKRRVDHPVDSARAHRLAPGSVRPLEQMRQRRTGQAFVLVVTSDQRNGAGISSAKSGDYRGQDAGQFRADQQQALFIAFGGHDLQQRHDLAGVGQSMPGWCRSMSTQKVPTSAPSRPSKEL
jgi:hypothetical protein